MLIAHGHGGTVMCAWPGRVRPRASEVSRSCKLQTPAGGGDRHSTFGAWSHKGVNKRSYQVLVPTMDPVLRKTVMGSEKSFLAGDVN